MPCKSCSNGKWKWGNNGKCIYDSKSECEKAGMAILIDRISKLKRNLDKTLKNANDSRDKD
jgi:hypothetical protein